MEQQDPQASRFLSATLAQLAGGLSDKTRSDQSPAPFVGSMTGNIIFMGEASTDALALILDRKAGRSKQG